ncbi:Acyl-CoA desaturase [Hirsutella minnesotensis 3608]|uniref:Acyl-CoA desaturase n=1 Tax=Hirsutella minnesotensis 3608 TaxID=1043627 RepID=A0A0F7ZXK9_9HYPO|nr:Acyl-CoA desaturase [Hirsutella minnesotensis 3608]
MNSPINPTMNIGDAAMPSTKATRKELISKVRHGFNSGSSYKKSNINWRGVVFVFGIPLAGLLLAPSTPLRWQTFVFSAICYSIAITGITAGYHRLWAHRSYEAGTLLRIYLAVAGATAAQGSIRWWVRDHRAHHRYSDTDKDPYSVQDGLWHAHVGWLLFRKDKNKVGRTDVSDLDSDALVVWQHRNFLALLIATVVVLPPIVCGLGWDDWRGGFVYGCLVRTFFVHQSTFCVNSLAHWLGSQPYDDALTPRDHLVTAIITFGEGYHNFHHEFPSDYRSSPVWYHWDPTKWLISALESLGLAYGLKTFRQNEIDKRRLQQQQKTTSKKMSQLDWGVPLECLPVVDWPTFKKEVDDNGKKWIAIGGVIYDVADFMDRHPGGKSMLKMGMGKDATQWFKGGVYNHSGNAHNLLACMRTAVLRGGMEVEVYHDHDHHDQ